MRISKCLIPSVSFPSVSSVFNTQIFVSPRIVPKTAEKLTMKFSVDEVEPALKMVNIDAAAGIDDVNNKFLHETYCWYTYQAV